MWVYIIMFLVNYSFNENSVEQQKENKTIIWQRHSLSLSALISVPLSNTLYFSLSSWAPLQVEISFHAAGMNTENQ